MSNLTMLNFQSNILDLKDENNIANKLIKLKNHIDKINNSQYTKLIVSERVATLLALGNSIDFTQALSLDSQNENESIKFIGSMNQYEIILNLNFTEDQYILCNKNTINYNLIDSEQDIKQCIIKNLI